MNRQTRYPKEVRERAVHLVHRAPSASTPPSGRRSARSPTKLGMTPETLRKWVRRAETDQGLRPGLTSTERERMKQLENENRELRRANEILKAAAVFFGAELDRERQEMTAFIDERREEFGVEPICEMLPIAPSTYYAAQAPGRPRLGPSVTSSCQPRSAAPTSASRRRLRSAQGLAAAASAKAPASPAAPWSA